MLNNAASHYTEEHVICPKICCHALLVLYYTPSLDDSRKLNIFGNFPHQRHLKPKSAIMTVPQYSSWQDKAALAQAKRNGSLAKVTPKLVGVPEARDLPQNSRSLPKEILTSREIELTENYPITELLRVLRQREVSVEEVTRAFLRRAALAHAAVRINSHADLT